MGQRCQCEKLLEMLENDWRLKIVGRETAMVWLELTRFIYRFGEDLVLRVDIRSGSPIGSFAELAFALRIDETQLATHLETLFERRLLVKAPCGGVGMPPELGLSARQKSARLNGSKGGRPRKDGPLPSGVSRKPEETQTRTERAIATTTTTTDSLDSFESDSVSGSDAAPSAGVSLGNELASLAGHRKSPTARDQALVDGWLDAGATREMLLEVFRAVLAREKCPRLPALSYFDGAVRDVLASTRVARPAPVEAVSATPETSLGDVALRKRLVGVSTMRGRHGSAPLAPTWNAFKATAARGEDAAAAAVAWIEVMERWEKGGFTGRTPPGFGAYVAERPDDSSEEAAPDRAAFG
jgi:hypothetical protein